MLKRLLTKIVGDPNQKTMATLRTVVEEVGRLEPRYKAMTDEQLREAVADLRVRVQSAADGEAALPEAFALVREASCRATGLRHYDVQIMGGILLYRGNVVEMRTGEGKTLVATLPLFLHALEGRGVHLVTVNDYLVRRDGGWMGKIFHFLGLSVACIGPESFSGLYDPDFVNPGAELEDERLVHWRPCTRAEAYLADITYGTSSEFGFDYLRDNMAMDKRQLVQRELYSAVIDEVDNILIDESRTPLIISGPASRSGKDYTRFADYVRRLKENTADADTPPNGHYDIDHKSRSVTLTELGIAEIERRIQEIDTQKGDSLYDPAFFHLTYYLDNAMKAEYLFHRDQQYMVTPDGQVVIVDEFTGRPMPSRRYSDGLHEAIEAKEGVDVKQETVTVATITLQNYFRMYTHLAGMTGTAMTDAEEFDRIYNLGVFPLPTNVEYIVQTGAMPLQERRRDEAGAKAIYYVKPNSEDPVFFKRTDYPDQVYGTLDAKDKAIVAEITDMHRRGRPVLVGTTSVEHSEKISGMLRRNKVPHNVLNAKLHQSEALVVAQAGRKGAVTISTNMAGRGTDILLGGNPEGLSAGALEEELFDRRQLAQLAREWLTKGEPAARALARKQPKLDESLVDALIGLRDRFDAAAAEIEHVQLPNFIARRLHELYAVDVAVARQVVSLVRLGALNQARDYLKQRDADTALAEEAVRLQELHGRYQAVHEDETQTAQFLADQLFDQHYTARAAVVRAVLARDLEEAQRVIAQAPGMSADLIGRVQQIVREAEAERRTVWELGGLHVVGSERHESRRIDNQLRGRAARQGDPGSSRFFLSLDDDLMLRFGGERLSNFMNRFDVPEDMPIESRAIERIIESSQTRLEGYNFDTRKNLVEYDDVMTLQRDSIYRERREILLSESVDLDARIQAAFDGAIKGLAQDYLEDYLGYVRREVDRAVADYTTEANDKVNLRPLLVRLRGLLPQLRTIERETLEGLGPRRLTERFMGMAAENVETGANIYQLLQALRGFVPLLPVVPNLGDQLAARRGDRLSVRESMRRDFITQVEGLYNDFLAENIPSAERTPIWDKAQHEINEAFVRFAVEGVSIETLRGQQDRFRQRVDDALGALLLDSLHRLSPEQLIGALDGYVRRQAEQWRKVVGEAQYREFQRLLLLTAIDREWRDYLTAMDDLRREISLEAVAQRDPKVMYKKRSFEMYQDMRRNIDEFVGKNFFQQIDQHQAFVRRQAAEAAQAAAVQERPAAYQVVQREKGQGSEVRRETPKLGRNDLCWCGSGKKYKNCHMDNDRQAQGGLPATAVSAPASGGKARRK